MSEATSAVRTHVKAEQPKQPPASSADPSRRIAELQVSAHLMALETGLFCVFQTPGQRAARSRYRFARRADHPRSGHRRTAGGSERQHLP